jgi:predicted Fe-Mo cluster-binding NifX family protein
MLEEEPSKKRNKISAVLIDESTGMIGPVPIEVLQDWGVKCGIAPEELSQEALMQAPSTNPVPNEDPSV